MRKEYIAEECPEGGGKLAGMHRIVMEESDPRQKG